MNKVQIRGKLEQLVRSGLDIEESNEALVLGTLLIAISLDEVNKSINGITESIEDLYHLLETEEIKVRTLKISL